MYLEMGTGFFAALGFSAIVGFLLSWFRVEEGHAAWISTFGTPKTDKEGRTSLYASGLHRKWPWERAHEFSLMEKVVKLGVEGRELEVLARDGTLLRVDGRARLRMNPKLAERFLFGVRNPLDCMKESLRGILAEEIGKFGSTNGENGAYSEIRRNRRKLDEAISSRLIELENRYGIDCRTVDLAEILPPADLADALNGVQKVKAQIESLQKRVEADCDRRILAAEHGVEIASTRAEASEREIRVLGAAVLELERSGSLDAYLRRRRDEASFSSRSVYIKTS